MRCTPVLSVVVLLSLLPGQVSGTGDPSLHPDKKRVVEEVTRKRDDMRDGKVERFNVRVKVRLKNGAKLNGVVKNGRLVEREEGIDFVEADRSNPDAGIRLYYFDETTSFVFLRWGEIDTHKVVVRLTDDEVRAIEKDMLERERKRQEERQAAIDAKAAAAGQKPPDGPGAEKDKSEKDKSKSGDKKAVTKESSTPLLTEFPPADGWSEAKLQEIQRRKIAVGAYPNEKEKRFLEVFADWKVQHAQSQATTGAGSKPAAGQPSPGASSK